MSCAEKVHWSGRVQPLLGSNYHVHQVGEPVLLHERDHATYRVNVHGDRGHLPRAKFPQVWIDRALDHASQHHVPLEACSLPGPLQGDVHCCGRLLLGPFWLGEDVQHRSDIGADVPLEIDYIIIPEVDLPVHV